MSWTDCPDPVPGDTRSVDAIENIIVPRARDIGGFEVRRVLPAVGHRMVGPFIFFDQMGPGELIAGSGLDVRPHPHINLATVTYLFDGQIRHRDSLGSDLLIEPGALNLMTAGRGIVHSERSDEPARENDQRIHGIQSWLALPEKFEEVAPSFEHFSTASLPFLREDGIYARVILGEFAGLRSPVKTYGEPLYVDVRMDPGSSLELPANAEERGIYLVSGTPDVDGITFTPERLLVIREGITITIRNRSEGPVRLMIVGGDAMDGPRHIWWNFVSSRKERIEQAKEEWRQGKFDTVPGDAEEFIPLPES